MDGLSRFVGLPEGIEPSFADYESAVLPLNYGSEEAVSHCSGRTVTIGTAFRGEAVRDRWGRRRDLNPQPDDYKSTALPIELHRLGTPYKLRVRKADNRHPV